MRLEGWQQVTCRASILRDARLRRAPQDEAERGEAVISGRRPSLRNSAPDRGAKFASTSGVRRVPVRFPGGETRAAALDCQWRGC